MAAKIKKTKVFTLERPLLGLGAIHTGVSKEAIADLLMSIFEDWAAQDWARKKLKTPKKTYVTKTAKKNRAHIMKWLKPVPESSQLVKAIRASEKRTAKIIEREGQERENIKVRAYRNAQGNLVVYPDSIKWQKRFKQKMVSLSGGSSDFSNFVKDHIPKGKRKDFKNGLTVVFSMSLFDLEDLYGEMINSPKKKNPKKKGQKKKHARKQKKQVQIPPPFKKLTKKKINKLKGLFRVHDEAVMNPDPADCPKCGLEYGDLKTGLDFQDVKDMLWIQDSDPEFWRYKRRGSVLGLWFEIKRGMWADHLKMCGGRPISEAEYLDHLEQVEDY